METSEKTFQFDDRKVASIDIEDFMMSGRLVDPNVMDIEDIWYKPHEFFEKIQSLLKEMEIPYRFGPVHVSRKGADYLADPMDKTSPRTDLKRWAFNTLITKIELKDIDAPEVDFNPAIGIGFVEQGVQICIGTNVSACSNMSIFGEYFMQSYGSEKMGMFEMFDELGKWLRNVVLIHKENVRILEKLRGIAITSRGGIQRLIGQLSIARELHMAGFDTPAPLDKDEISDFQKRIISQHGNLLERDFPMELYELYNICTNILTHSEKNLHNKWEDILKMGEFICEHYDVFEESTTMNAEVKPTEPEAEEVAEV